MAQPAVAFAEPSGDPELFSQECGIQTKCLSQLLRTRGEGHCVSTRASVTKRHALGSFNTRHVFPHKSGGLKSEMKVSEGWFLPRPLSLAGRCVFTWSAFHACLCPNLL